MKKKSFYIPELDSLRGLMSLWVVVAHLIPCAGLSASNWFKPFRLLGNGGIPVQVFIIMSGFVITLLLTQKKEAYGFFIKRRFFRLFPVYFVCLILSSFLLDIGIEVFSNLDWQHHKNLKRIEILQHSKDYFWQHFSLHLTMLHGLNLDGVLKHASYAILGQAWSISLEWQYYLIAPFFVFMMKKKWILNASLVVFFILSYLFADNEAFILTSIAYFLVGIFSFYFYQNYIERDQPIVVGKYLYLFLLLLAWFVGSVSVLIWFLIFGCVIQRTEKSDVFVKTIKSFLSQKIFIYLGKISYSVYLSHMIVIQLVMWFFLKMKFEFTQIEYFLFLSIPVFLITIGFSHILYHCIEKPFIDMFKKTKPMKVENK